MIRMDDPLKNRSPSPALEDELAALELSLDQAKEQRNRLEHAEDPDRSADTPGGSTDHSQGGPK